MGTLGAYLSSFSGNFRTALLLWPFLSFALTLPILAYLYHRDGQLKGTSALAAYVSVLYIAGLGCFTLYPLPSGTTGPGITYGIEPQFNPLNFIFDIQRDGVKAVFQLLFNIALFMPLGFLAKTLLRLGWLPTLGLALTATCLIETAQLTGLFGIYPFAYRTFEVDDIICNTLGGMLGWLAGCLFAKVALKRPPEKPAITHEPGFARRFVALWLDAMIIGFCTLAPWLLAALLWEAVLDRALVIGGLDAGTTADAMLLLCFAASFIVVEAVIPWMHDGSTPGGMFVRMSFETRPRTGARRVLFYVVRAFVLLGAFAAPPFAIPVLALFYLIARKMPYDFLP